jgi:uncharacterized integral membrane protein
MNRSFLIIFIPALIVAVYYIFALRHFGLPAGFLRLGVVVAGFLLATWLVRRRGAGKSNSSGP